MEYLFGTDSDKISKFSTGTLTLNESSENYKDCDFDADTAKKLYQAIYEDAADQKLQKYNLTNALKDPEETGSTLLPVSVWIITMHLQTGKTYMTGLMIITEIRENPWKHPQHMVDLRISVLEKTAPISYRH